jgi:hypothetical protein
MNEIKPINPIIEIHMNKESSKKDDIKKKKLINNKTSFVDILESLQTKNEENKEVVVNQQSTLNLKPRIDFNEEIVEDKTKELLAKKAYTN